jgi:hypothetical protein
MKTHIAFVLCQARKANEKQSGENKKARVLLIPAFYLLMHKVSVVCYFFVEKKIK